MLLSILKILNVISDLRRGTCWNVLGKRMQKAYQKQFRVEKVIKRKGDTLYVKWKSMIILLIARVIWMT